MKSFRESAATGISFLPWLLSTIFFLFFQIPRFNVATSYRDEGILAYSAYLVTQGQLPYRDFFAPITPVSYYIQAAWYQLFGLHLITGRVAYVVMAVIILALLARVIKVEQSWKYLLLFATALLLVWSGGFGFYNTYGQFFAVVCMVLALFYFQTKQRVWLALAGVVVALVFFTKQTYGMFAALALLMAVIVNTQTARHNLLKDVLTLVIPGIITGLVILSYFLFHQSLWQLMYYCFIFSREVKSHAFPFFINRLVFAPVLFLAIRFFVKANRKQKLYVLALGALAILLYFGIKPARVGRLVTYLADVLFYFMTVMYVVPITVLALLNKFPAHLRYQVSTLALMTLALFFGSVGSGYSWVTIQITGPFFVPLVVLSFAAAAQVTRWRPHILNVIASLCLLGYTLPIVVGPLNQMDLVYEMYPVEQASEYSPVPLYKGIKLAPAENRDLMALRNFVDSQPADTSVVCFPYCPMFNVVVERNSDTFFNFFIFEMFRPQDQPQQIETMKSNNVDLVVFQKPGYMEPEANLENARYKELLDFIYANYRPALTTENFLIYQKT